MSSVWNTLASVNCSDKVEKKNKLTYLSWVFAWSEVKKRYPDASYRVYKDEDGKPYTYDENLGYMCYTTATIDSQMLEMWLPVMDGANKSMKAQPYTYKVKDWDATRAQNKTVYTDKAVEAATMFDINKTIMRCLVKNLAMFGMGIYIYAGDDLPDPETVQALAKDEYEELCERLAPSIEAIKESIESGSLSAGSEAWKELTEDEKMGLWKAPSKGGCFTTLEREVMKSTEFRKASGEQK